MNLHVNRYDAKSDKLCMSYARFKAKNLPLLGSLLLRLFEIFGLVEMRREVGEKGEYIECSNLTIINLALKFKGPTHERILTTYLLVFQVVNYGIYLWLNGMVELDNVVNRERGNC